MPPAVSVIMPVYNAAPTVARAVQSILDSTFTDFEFIILDDGSTDDTAAVVEAMGDPRIALHRKPHRGIVASLNEAVQLAKTPLIARMDGDDVAASDRLAKQLTINADIVGSQVRIVDDAGREVESMQRYQQWINDHLTHDAIAAMRFVESPLVHPTVLAKREVFELGYREGDFPEDYDLWLRALAAGFTIEKVAEPLLDWHESFDRLTRRDERYSAEAFDRCRREYLLAGPLQNVQTIDHWGTGKTGKPWLRYLQSQGFNVRHLYDINPRQVGENIHGNRVIHPDHMPPPDGTPLVIAVGAAGARENILEHITPRHYRPGVDTWFVA